MAKMDSSKGFKTAYRFELSALRADRCWMLDTGYWMYQSSFYLYPASSIQYRFAIHSPSYALKILR